MTHAFHDSLPGYDVRQILIDGCSECERRGNDLEKALASMDKVTFWKAWHRATRYAASDPAVGPVSKAEAPLLRVLAAIVTRLA